MSAIAPAPVNVSDLPSHAFGHRGLMWWGTLGVIAIEGTVFALAIVAYFYVWSHSHTWPLSVAPPDLMWGTVNTAILVLSCWPNHYTKRAAEQYDLRKVRIGMVACLFFAIAFLALRVGEFASLNSRWDTNAYGSLVWVLLGLHTTHLLTDALDTAVLGVLMFTGPLEERRFVDVSENAFYWYFVVLAWLPIYAVIYWAPRLLASTP
jgi:cytochrome c oxidase subunit I+III